LLNPDYEIRILAIEQGSLRGAEMTSSAFDYEKPTNIQQAIALLSVPRAVALAGGQSLIPLLNRRSIAPKTVVDISQIPELRKIGLDHAFFQIGAAARLSEIQRSPALAEFPLLSEALMSTANPTIRNRATLVGNLVRANPFSELSIAVVALDAQIVIGGVGKTRKIAASDFFVGPYVSAIGEGEIVIAVEFPRPKGALMGCSFSEITARASAPPLICVAARIGADAQAIITDAYLVVGGITGRPARCVNLEAALKGASVQAAAASQIPTENLVASPELSSSDYALGVLPVVLERAVARAISVLAPISRSMES
jgi:carbon-monoxide dehydrogenase medium subunit